MDIKYKRVSEFKWEKLAEDCIYNTIEIIPNPFSMEDLLNASDGNPIYTLYKIHFDKDNYAWDLTSEKKITIEEVIDILEREYGCSRDFPKPKQKLIRITEFDFLPAEIKEIPRSLWDIIRFNSYILVDQSPKMRQGLTYIWEVVDFSKFSPVGGKVLYESENKENCIKYMYNNFEVDDLDYKCYEKVSFLKEWSMELWWGNSIDISKAEKVEIPLLEISIPKSVSYSDRSHKRMEKCLTIEDFHD